MLSQLALSLAVQDRVPPPVLEIDNVLAAGLPPPCVAEKERLAGLKPMAGCAGGVTVTVTGIVTEEAPVALMVMAPLCVPVVNEPVDAVMVIRPEPVPDDGLRANQLALSFADQDKLPPPELLMLIV